MTKINIDGDQYTSPEEVPLNSRLKWFLELSAFPLARLEYLTPIRNVRPCSECGEPVARVRLGREVRTVNAFRDEARAWVCNVLGEHECAGCCQ
jgi:hypothetical protein